MRRGTRVSQAYVAVTVDGDGINEEIVDSVDEAGPGVEKAGKEHGKRYGSGFSDGLEPTFSHASENIGAEFNRRMEEKGTEGGERYGDRFDKSLKKLAKRIGNNVGRSIGKSIETELMLSMKRIELMLEAQLGDLTRKVSGNGGQGGGGGKPPAPGGNAFPLPEFDDRRWAEAARMDRQWNEKMERVRVQFVEKFLAKREALQVQSNKVILKHEEQLVKDQRKLYDSLAKEAKRRDVEMWKVRNATAKAHYKYLADLERGLIDERGNTVKRGSTKDTDFDLGGSIGKLFGAGSRNNFFNFLGESIGGVISMAARLEKTLAPMLTKLASSSGAGTRLATGLGAAGASAIAAAAAILVLVAAMSALVSVASALTALLVALTATIASALTGAVLVLGGAFVAAAAAGGLLAAAFLSMNDAQKKMLSESFKPLKAELVGLGQLVIRDLVPHFQTWADNLKEAIALAGPAAAVMGEAFGRAGDRLTKALSGPGFRLFSEQLAVYLPSIVKRFTGALSGFLNGMMGIFAALLPYVQQFAGYLNRAAAEFSKWANSAKGQNAIEDFVDRALDSLKSLWDFVREFTGFVTDLLFSPQAQQAGNTLFDSLADSFDGFRKKLDKAIQNGDLEDWFKDAIKFGGQMKKVVIAIKDAFVELDNSGVLDSVGTSLETVAGVIDACNKVLGPLVKFLGFTMPSAAQTAEDALNGLTFFNLLGHLDSLLSKIGSVISALKRLSGMGKEGGSNQAPGPLPTPGPAPAGPSARVAPGWALRTTTGGDGGGKGGDKDWAQHLINIGNASMNGNGTKGGALGSGGGSGVSGNSKGDADKKWKNPFIKFANSLIKDGPSIAKQLANAMTQVLTQVNRAVASAAKAVDLESARAALTDQMASVREAGRSGVQLAQSALNSAAENLKNAGSAKEAARALKQVRRAQEDLEQALKNQKRLNRVADLLGKQKIVNNENVDRLLNGLKVKNATLADYAEARARLAVKIEKANDALADAIADRDNFNRQITDSVKAFGALTTAQGQVIDGVEQALTAGDITGNLSTRLDKIKKFQSDLRILLAQGLSNDAYKQILEAGVDQGSTFADALIQGGIGSITQTNQLVSEINKIAGDLGLETSNRLYQAGVDAAQGLVDGLESLSADLDSAATKLGTSIANAIKKALGIKSPSTVLMGMMDYVGDGAVIGLDNQAGKVGAAAKRFSSNIAVSPEVAAYAAQQRGSVSGNGGPTFDIDVHVETPTTDPKAVAMEAVNELTGRLP